MKKPYRVLLIIPPGYQHSSAFLEVAFLLKSTLTTLGHDCDIGFNELVPGRTHILLGSHLLQWSDNLASCDYIPYQLEQLSAQEGVYSENLHRILAGGSQVWDYSRENIDFLAQRGIPAVHVPVGYHPNLEQVSHAASKDIDVLFYGSVGERRKKVLDDLKARGVNVQAIFGVYGKQRDELVGRAKIILNIHHYSTKIFESVRVSYLLNNRCCVVSEESSVYPYPGVDLDLVRYDNLADHVLGRLSQPGDMDRVGKEAYRQFKQHYGMTGILQRALQPRLQSSGMRNRLRGT